MCTINRVSNIKKFEKYVIDLCVEIIIPSRYIWNLYNGNTNKFGGGDSGNKISK